MLPYFSDSVMCLEYTIAILTCRNHQRRYYCICTFVGGRIILAKLAIFHVSANINPPSVFTGCTDCSVHELMFSAEAAK